MLTRIHIRDFAIIDELELEFGAGLSVLTGETGAGKSILIDALGLVLGDRAASDAVRDGADRAQISLGLNIGRRPAALEWLAEHDLEADDECWLRRVIGRDGRSKAYINGTPAPLNLVRQLGEMLVDIHGQHEHQSLLRAETQRLVLDSRAANDGRLGQLAAHYREFRALQLRIDKFATQDSERAHRVDLLTFQVRELKDLGLGVDEFDALGEEHRRLAHAGRLKDGSLAAYMALYESDEEALDALMGKIIAELEPLRELDAKLDEPLELLLTAQTQLREAASELRRYADGLDLDPARLAWVEARLADIHHLARKHRLAPSQLPAHLIDLEAELASLRSPDFDLDQLRARLQAVEREYRSLAHAVHEARVAAATELNAAVTDAMQEVGMAGGRFEVALDYRDDDKPGPYGLDRVEFQVSGAAGQSIRPLSKVASGGELSRISLAIQIIAARGLSIPTLIFDEVDAGIGGGVAEAVGRQLRALGEQRQVLCVTHLPQVAAQAHHHFQVAKRTHKQATRTRVTTLELNERVEEVARMLGGLELTEKTRAHAQEMITRSQAQ